MLRRVRSSNVALRSASGSTVAGEGSCGLGSGSGDSDTGSKEVVRVMVRRVRSMRDMDIRDCGFLTGEGVALPMALTISSAKSSSGSSSGGSEGSKWGEVRYGGVEVRESECCSGSGRARDGDAGASDGKLEADESVSTSATGSSS